VAPLSQRQVSCCEVVSYHDLITISSFADNCFMQPRAKALSDIQQMLQVQVVNKISPS